VSVETHHGMLDTKPHTARRMPRGALGGAPARKSTFRPVVCTIHTVTSRAVLRRLREAGWFEVRHKGSHVQLKHPERPGLVTVPHPKRDLPKGTVRSIERQSGIRLLG
jgi:predicted RNA binding protein YcfA (HicA-like mRNA interferase family)